MFIKEYKVYINYLLVRLKIRKVLPAKIINKVLIEDNNDPLVKVDIKAYDIILDKRISEPVYLRKEVCSKLYNICHDMKEKNLRVKLYDAYRTIEEQNSSWEKRLIQTRNENPNVSDEDLIRLNKMKVSNCYDEKSIGGHQSGGALDISLCDLNGNELDFGTSYEEYNEKTFSFAKNISKKQKENRKILFNEMKKYNFINFPCEWWHYSYGDNMWSAYKFKNKAFYGYIKPDEDIK